MHIEVLKVKAKDAMRYFTYMVAAIYFVYGIFVVAYPAVYNGMVLAECAVVPATAALAYYLAYKVYGKVSCMAYFVAGFVLSLIALGAFALASCTAGSIQVPLTGLFFCLLNLVTTCLNGVMLCGVCRWVKKAAKK